MIFIHFFFVEQWLHLFSFVFGIFFKYMENSKKIKNGLNEGISQFQPEFSYQRYESVVP
jgi:hypothetical protein